MGTLAINCWKFCNHQTRDSNLCINPKREWQHIAPNKKIDERNCERNCVGNLRMLRWNWRILRDRTGHATAFLTSVTFSSMFGCYPTFYATIKFQKIKNSFDFFYFMQIYRCVHLRRKLDSSKTRTIAAKHGRKCHGCQKCHHVTNLVAQYAPVSAQRSQIADAITLVDFFIRRNMLRFPFWVKAENWWKN